MDEDILPDDILADDLDDLDDLDLDISGNEAQAGGRRRRKRKDMDDVSIAKRKADADEMVRRKSETPEQTLQRRKAEGAERANAARKKKMDVAEARRVEVQRARKAKSLSAVQTRRLKTVEVKKKVKRRETERNVRQTRAAKERAAGQKAPKKKLVESVRRSESAKSDYVKSKREALTERHAAAAKRKAADQKVRRAADAAIKRKERTAALKKKMGAGPEKTRSAAANDAATADTMRLKAPKPNSDRPPIPPRSGDPAKAKGATDAAVNQVNTKVAHQKDMARTAADKAARQREPTIPKDVDANTPRLKAAKEDADAANTRLADAKKNRTAVENDGLEAKARRERAQQEAEVAKKKAADTARDADAVRAKKKAEEEATAKRGADEEANVAKKKKDEEDAIAAKKKQDEEEAAHSRDVDAHRDTVGRRGARYLVGASFLTGFPFPFPGSYGRRGRRPPLSYGVDKPPTTPGGLPVDLFSTARPEDIYKAAILDGKQDGYAAGYADGREGGRASAMNKEVALRDPGTILQDVLSARISTSVKLERQAFCVIKLAEVQVKGLNYIDAYPQCVDDTGKPAATTPATVNPSARDISGQEAYTKGYKEEFVPQYRKGYDAGFIRGREEALAGISGAPISGAPSGPSGASGASGPISGAPTPSGPSGPAGPGLGDFTGEGPPPGTVEQAGGGNPYPDKRQLYDSDSDEENFLTKDEFLYLLTKGVNKKRIEKIRKLIAPEVS